MLKSKHAPGRPATVWTAAAIAAVATLCSVYVISQFLRNSVGVIAPNLAAELRLSAGEIGLIASAFFFVFAGVQLPLGLAIDRFGPKKCMLVCALLVVIGALAFASAQGAGGLMFGRALLGLGCSAFLMAPLVLYARWFPPNVFSTLVGIQLGIGNLGALLATAPLAMVAAAYGWRSAFLGVAVLAVCASVMIFVMIRGEPRNAANDAAQENWRESFSGLVEAMRQPSVGRLFLMQMALYSSFVVLVGLWGGPYLSHVYGYDLEARGQLLFVPAVLQILGSFVWGPMDRLCRGHKIPVLVGTGFAVLGLAILALAASLSIPLLVAVLAGFGFATAVNPVLIAHGKSLFPPHLIGRGMTLMNVGSMGGAFVMQAVSGAVIELFPETGGAYPPEAYRIIFGIQAVLLLAALALYAGARDPWRPAGG